MDTDTNAIAALIGSRICHDLISPIGAVNNGIELLELSGAASSPELSLVAESIAHANARIRFFRLAFGVVSKNQETGSDEINSILTGLHSDDRMSVSEFPSGHFPRQEVRAVLLAMLCAEQAIPYGGKITIEETKESWVVRASADRLNTEADLWNLLNGIKAAALPAPAFVQFLILPTAARDADLNCVTQVSDHKAEIILSRV